MNPRVVTLVKKKWLAMIKNDYLAITLSLVSKGITCFGSDFRIIFRNLLNKSKFFEMLPTSPSIITITLNSSIATN